MSMYLAFVFSHVETLITQAGCTNSNHQGFNLEVILISQVEYAYSLESISKIKDIVGRLA